MSSEENGCNSVPHLVVLMYFGNEVYSARLIAETPGFAPAVFGSGPGTPKLPPTRGQLKIERGVKVSLADYTIAAQPQNFSVRYHGLVSDSNVDMTQGVTESASAKTDEKAINAILLGPYRAMFGKRTDDPHSWNGVVKISGSAVYLQRRAERTNAGDGI